MSEPTPETLESARLTVLEAIEAEFGQVRREGGISLHQMNVLDDSGDDEALRAAETLDPEVRWQDVSDEKLQAPRIAQSLVFLDARGYRFYAPAYLRLLVRGWGRQTPSADGFWWSLAASRYARQHHYPLLSAGQQRVIARFLRLTCVFDLTDAADAESYLARYWHAFE